MASSQLYTGITDCVSYAPNTGGARCAFYVKNFIGAIIVPQGSFLSASERLALKTTIDANCINSTAALRWKPVRQFINLEDKTPQVSINQTGYGNNQQGHRGKYFWSFEHDGGHSLHKLLMQYNNKQNDYAIYFIEGTHGGYGAIVGCNGADGAMLPFDLSMILVDNYKIGGGDTDKAMIAFELADNTQFDNDLCFEPLSASYKPASIVGLEQTYLQMTSATMTTLGVATIKWMGETTNLYDRFSSYLTTTTCKAYNKLTGSEITITSITGNAVTRSFAFNLDETDPDWPGTAGMEIEIKTILSALQSAGALGISECSLTVPRA